MKVVLLAINSKYVHSALAVWVLAKSIAQLNPVVIECNINQENDDIVNEVVAHRPDFIGISTYIWNAKKLPVIIGELKKNLPNAKIVLGGPEAEHNADFWINQGVCAVLKGEGEASLPKFLGQPQKTANDPFTPEYLNALKGKIAYIESSRGCPFNCAYCLSGADAVRYFDMDNVKLQIRKLITADVRIIKFVDRTFNCNAARVYDLIEFIIGLNSPVRFHFEVAADLFDERTLALLATAPAGLIQIEVGIQSFFAPTLKAATRKTNLEKLVKNIQVILKANNIHVHVDLIAGLPHENLEHFATSFNLAYEIGAHKLQLGFLKMLHGSQLRKNETAIIYDKNPPYEIIESPWLSREDLRILHLTEGALQNTYNKEHFLKTISYTLSVANLSPFEFYKHMGQAFQKDGMPLEAFAGLVFDFCNGLDAVDENKLKEAMICDWLSMVKGVNMPAFLKHGDKKQMTPLIAHAEMALGRKIRKSEAALLPDGSAVYVNTYSKDPVTGLYELFFVK